MENAKKSSALKSELLSRLQDVNRFSLEVHEDIGSTNDRAKALGESAAPSNTAVVALSQSKGRGRLGRGFYSPLGGIYLSLLLRPSCDASCAGLFTAAAAVAVCRAIGELCDLQCQIKWPNDIIYDGKKAGGILTEAKLNQQGRFEYMVIGVGLNLYAPVEGFPPELQDATALFGNNKSAPSYAEAAAKLLESLDEQLAEIPDAGFLSEYRERSMLIGRSISAIKGGQKVAATALCIDEAARLIVGYPDGTEEALLSAEVSIRENGR